MAAGYDALVEVPLTEWSNLKETLKSRWPSSIYAYYLLEYQERWIRNGCDVTKVYLPYGNSDNGIVVISKLTAVLYSVTIFPMNENENHTNPLIESLISTKKIDWNSKSGVMMSCVHDSLKSIILDVIKNLDMEVMNVTHSCGVFKSKEDASKSSNSECPDDVYIKPLKKNNALQMNEAWPHRFPGSEELFFKLIGYNGGYGLFTRSTDEMIAWVTQNDFGSLGNLYCGEEHRRKGYAQLLIRAMERKLAQNGEDVHAFFVKKNQRSTSLFKKMGYESFADDVFWIHAVKSEFAKIVGEIFK